VLEQVVETMENIRKVLSDRHIAFAEAHKITDTEQFWREELKLQKDDEVVCFASFLCFYQNFELVEPYADLSLLQLEKDDVLERLESGRPMVDDDSLPENVERVQTSTARPPSRDSERTAPGP
jgi:hypothetical protein